MKTFKLHCGFKAFAGTTFHAQNTRFCSKPPTPPLHHNCAGIQLQHALPLTRRQHCQCNRLVPHAEQSNGSQTTTDTKDTTTANVPATNSSSSSSNAVQPPSNQATLSFLSAPEQQSAAYLFLTGTSLAFGVAALAAPELLLSVALGVEPTALDVAFTRIAGATMAVSAAVEYSLQDAVVSGHLKSATYQKLMLGILAKNVLYLAAFLMSPGLWNPVLFSFYPTAAGASITITAATLQSAIKQSGAASVSEGMSSLFTPSLPKTAAGWIYSTFILLYIATVAACYAPEVMFTGQPMTAAASLLKHTWAPGFLLAAAACWVLADAADRNRLTASTFRRLNLGLAVLEAGYAVVFGYSILTGLAASDGSSWSNLIGSVLICKYCLYQWVVNDKNKKW